MDELTATQLEELRQSLTELRDHLQRLVTSTEEGARPVELSQPIGRLSRMDALQQQAMAKATREGHQNRLRQINVALAALERDEYGYCRRCEEPIGYPRLKARPETPFCRDCQSGLEEGR